MINQSAVIAAGLCYSYRTHPAAARKPALAGDQDQNSTQPSRALQGVSLEVDQAEIFGLVGPNGSGKTTLLRILTGLIEPDGGTLTVFDYDVTRRRNRARHLFGVVFQNPSLDIKLTVQENLLHHGHLYGLSGGDLRQRIDRQLENFAIDDRRSEFVEALSGGLRRRVELAKALLHRPRLLVLDEPSTGLDPLARRDLWDRLEETRRTDGVTILVATHLLDEADRCDRLAFLNRGKVVTIDTPSRLKSQIGGDVVTITPAGADPQVLCRAIAERFEPWPNRHRPALVDGKIRLESNDGAAMIPRLAEVFTTDIDSISIGRPSLEDVFVQMTGDRFGEPSS